MFMASLEQTEFCPIAKSRDGYCALRDAERWSILLTQAKESLRGTAAKKLTRVERLSRKEVTWARSRLAALVIRRPAISAMRLSVLRKFGDVPDDLSPL
jgi:hypothetical protein